MIVQAKSGTGKTCVFAVVALEMVSTMSIESQVYKVICIRIKNSCGGHDGCDPLGKCAY